MLKIDETKSYSKLVKERGDHQFNVQDGVVREGKLRAFIQSGPASMSLDPKKWLIVEDSDNDWYIHTSSIKEITELPGGGYTIKTRNSTYTLT